MRARTLQLLLLAFCLIASPLFAAPVEHVIIVSMDGGRPDMVLACNTPNIHKLASEGSFTWWAQTIKPSVTLISHCSMLTGCQPAKHGVDWNDWQPERGYVKTSTCFEIAHKAGLKTAMFVGKGKLKHIAKPGTVDTFEAGAGAEQISQAAARHFVEAKPAILFVHYVDPDAAGHGNGWGATEAYSAAIENCDKGVGILVDAIREAGLEDKTIVIVTADHGGHKNSHGSEDVRDMTIPWVCYGKGNIVAGEIQDPVSTCDTAATAVYALGLEPDPTWDGKPVKEIFKPEPATVGVQ